MMVLVLRGVLGGWLGGGLHQEGEQSSWCGHMLFCRISNWGSNIALLGQKVPTYMMDQCRGTVRVLTVLLRGTTGGRARGQTPAALDRVLQGVDPPGVASSHLHDVHITEEDDQRRGEVWEHSYESRVAGSAGPVDRTAVHGNHVADGAPAEERRAAGGQGLQPDPQDHSTGPPQRAARAVVQTVHDGMVPVQGDGSQGQHRCCAVHRGGVTHVQAEGLAHRRWNTMMPNNGWSHSLGLDVVKCGAAQTYSAVHPSMVHDGQSDEGHDPSAHQQVAHSQVYDQHGRHRVERFGCSHDNND